MNWHYLTFADFDQAVAIANREATCRHLRFSVVMDRFGNYSVWPGTLHADEACYVAIAGDAK